MNYHPYSPKDFNAWLAMALDLWPKYKKAEMTKILRETARSKNEKTFIARDGRTYVGFINVSLRYEYIPGAESAPVGYVEGIYVKSKYRKQGVAADLVALGEKWSHQKGAKQMASDTWTWNKDSQRFHKKLGFKVAEKLVHFIKGIE